MKAEGGNAFPLYYQEKKQLLKIVLQRQAQKARFSKIISI